MGRKCHVRWEGLSPSPHAVDAMRTEESLTSKFAATAGQALCISISGDYRNCNESLRMVLSVQIFGNNPNESKFQSGRN